MDLFEEQIRNPFLDHIRDIGTLEVQAESFIVEIGLGKIIKQFGIQDASSTVDLSLLANVVYIVQLTSESVTEKHKLVLHKKFLVFLFIFKILTKGRAFI